MTKKHFFIALGIIVLAILILSSMGRIPFCKCGVIALWSSDVLSSQQSQQLADPYTPSHIIHGIAFYFILWAFFRNKLTIAQRLLISIGLEAGWEILENTDFIINRYREATFSLDYYGDSIFNSFGDILSAMLGFFIAWKWPKWATISLIVVFELGALYFIKDNLTINIIMLLHPIEAIKNWQLGL